jgi:hypothetical protein
MDFDSFLGQAWDNHASDPNGVAQRLSEQGTALLTSESQLVQLMNLTHHLHGEHLHEWAAGAACFNVLRASGFYVADGESGQMARRCVASLALSAQEDFSLVALSASDQIRVQAMAAANLADNNPTSGMRMLQAALDQAASSGLPAADPMNRALAVSGHNLAAALEEKAVLNADETKLMLMASQASRVYWERAGTWLQVERAEYQLTITFLKVGELAHAEIHARECGRIVAENEAPALERFFAFEALARVMRAAKTEAAFKLASEQARATFEELDEADRSYCLESLNKLLRS